MTDCLLTSEQLLGLSTDHLVTGPRGFLYQADCAAAFARLVKDAGDDGYDLRPVSVHRDFDRQLVIWNAKALGQRKIHDDCGKPLDISSLSPEELVKAIMRFSALPGASRHHWGTDLDVYDAAAVPADYEVLLEPAEVDQGGVFDPLHCWLDKKIQNGDSHGFFRPYSRDAGGVAPERWHLSYAPVALSCSDAMSVQLLRTCLEEIDLALRDVVLNSLETIFQRYVIPAQRRP